MHRAAQPTGWSDYKARCDSPSTMSRWMIEQTLELSCGERQITPALERVLRGVPLEKPGDHHGGRTTDMFELDLDAPSARRIHDVVVAAVRDGRTTSGTRQRGLGGFAEAWREYLNYVETKEADRT